MVRWLHGERSTRPGDCGPNKKIAERVLSLRMTQVLERSGSRRAVESIAQDFVRVGIAGSDTTPESWAPAYLPGI